MTFCWKRSLFNKANGVFLRMASQGLESLFEGAVFTVCLLRMCPLKTPCGKLPKCSTVGERMETEGGEDIRALPTCSNLKVLFSCPLLCSESEAARGRSHQLQPLKPGPANLRGRHPTQDKSPQHSNPAGVEGCHSKVPPETREWEWMPGPSGKGPACLMWPRWGLS